MSGSSKADMAAAATSTVITIDQLMKAIESGHEGKNDHAKQHLGYAAIGAAVAVGAMELLRRDEAKKREKEQLDEVVIIDHKAPHHDRTVVKVTPNEGRDHEPAGHRRRLAEEIAGAYALGEEIMGYKKHHVAHVVAEVLGAVAVIKNTKDHVHSME